MTTLAFPKRRQERGGTAADLTTVNEILLDREWCKETDTGRYKLGDGVTPWNSLAYCDPFSLLVQVIINGDTLHAPSADAVYDALLAEAVARALADSSEATARATADALLAPLASPAFTGVPTVPTPVPGTNTGQAASTAFVTAAVAAGGGGSSGISIGLATQLPNIPLFL